MGTYTKLAHLMATYPEVMILRKFSQLNAKNLLYYEAELATLEHELGAIELEDQHCEEMPRRDYATSWAAMAASGDGVNDSTTIRGERMMNQRDKLQWQTFLKIREQLCKYSEQEGNAGTMRKFELIPQARRSAHPTDAAAIDG